jgi:hypothetical protein
MPVVLLLFFSSSSAATMIFNAKGQLPGGEKFLFPGGKTTSFFVLVLPHVTANDVDAFVVRSLVGGVR